jgi:hypothetical protein
MNANRKGEEMEIWPSPSMGIGFRIRFDMLHK